MSQQLRPAKRQSGKERALLSEPEMRLGLWIAAAAVVVLLLVVLGWRSFRSQSTTLDQETIKAHQAAKAASEAKHWRLH